MKPNPHHDDGLFRILKGLVRGPVHAILSQLYGEPTGSRPIELDLLRYVDLLEYTAVRRADQPNIAAMLVRREPMAQAWAFTQVFLDRGDNLIAKDERLLGRVIRARAVDDELADLFGDAESITVELP